MSKGFTLMEVVVSIGILAILVGCVFGVYTLIINQVAFYRDKTTVSYLAGQYMEIARNLPYSAVGTTQGNPHGDLPDLANALTLNFGGNDYKVYYSVSYADDPADGTILAGTDSAPTDYKQVKLYITNTKTNLTSSFFTNVSPKGLEGLVSGGALNISVINAVGQPVQGATIHITNTQTSPTYDLTRTSDSSGNWIEVGLPGSANSYHITATKNGYSSDQTYPVSVGNPNPIKPDSTILVGQVTQVSFAIDELSTLNFLTLSETCSPVGQIAMGIKGSKLIGTPNVLKFDNSYTSNGAGKVFISQIESDTYTPGIAEEGQRMIYGTFPIQKVDLMPGTEQDFRIILGPYSTNSLLTVVKDSSTGNVIEGASVNLKSSSQSYDQTKITGGSVWYQQDWSGGSGQADFSDDSKYFTGENVSDSIIPAAVRLVKLGEDYVSSGILESSSYDTGTEDTVYTTLTWQPTSQDPATAIKFQIATNNDNETWSYKGPNGTANTYYEVSGTAINSEQNKKRYVRYKAFLSTVDVSKTPVLTSVNVNYVSGCNTPGQVIFTDLSGGTDYELSVSMEGYQTQTLSAITVDGRKLSEVMLSK